MVFTLLLVLPGRSWSALAFAGSLAGRVTAWPIGGELGKMVGWGNFATRRVRTIAATDDIRTIWSSSAAGSPPRCSTRCATTGLDIRAYLDDRRGAVRSLRDDAAMASR